MNNTKSTALSSSEENRIAAFIAWLTAILAIGAALLLL